MSGHDCAAHGCYTSADMTAVYAGIREMLRREQCPTAVEASAPARA